MPRIAEIEYTSNPNAVKFILKEPVAFSVPRIFPSPEIAQADPLAKALFEVGGIESLVMIDKWITVTKDDGTEWNKLLPKLAPFIRQAPSIAIDSEKPGMSINSGAQDDPFLQKVFAVLKERIYPFMAADGGGMEIVSRSGKQVMIRYTGACQNCPAGLAGTLMAIEGMLRAEVDPEIKVITI
ncbi:MAG: NifU family protein [Holophagales bacterium]|jgi:Fe-S cluster biogenesis protein NfuA|nr:NifU family protein [Holophagales bacterium]